jgi:thymidylate synthase (FAD)
LRSSNGTQKEHQEIALLVKDHFTCQFPIIAEALGWCPEEEDECPCRYTNWEDIQPCLRIE